MFISQQGLNLIKQFEGCILSAYDDYNDEVVTSSNQVQGTLTIGYGHIEGVYVGQTITQDQAEQMLKDDMVRYCNQTQSVLDSISLPYGITQNMFDALVSFEYNLGQGCLRTLLADGTRDKQTVADMMLEYRNKGSQWEQGLLRRRNAERELFLEDGSSVVANNATTQATTDNIYLQLQRELNAQGFKDKNGNTLVEDGIPGELTLSACPLVKQGARGNIAKWIQLRCGAVPDGVYGPATKQAVMYMQQKWGISDDGVVGPQTFRKLLGM